MLRDVAWRRLLAFQPTMEMSASKIQLAAHKPIWCQLYVGVITLKMVKDVFVLHQLSDAS